MFCFLLPAWSFLHAALSSDRLVHRVRRPFFDRIVILFELLLRHYFLPDRASLTARRTITLRRRVYEHCWTRNTGEQPIHQHLPCVNARSGVDLLHHTSLAARECQT